MKTRRIAFGLSLAALLLATGGNAAQGANNPRITVDETGNGTLIFPGISSTLPRRRPDPRPGPGGLRTPP